MTRRLVSFGHTAVALQADDERAQTLVDFLFRFTASDAAYAPYTEFRIALAPSSGNLAVYRDGVLLRADASDADVAEYLLGEVTFRLMDQSRDGVTLHAGALTWRGRGVLLPGAIGAGKTTLTAWLVHKGLGYLTDEMVWSPAGTDTLDAFTRPLNVKKPGRAIVQTFFDVEKNRAQVLQSTQVDLIMPARPAAVPNPLPLGWILFPNYQPATPPQIERLTQAQAGLLLTAAVLNAGNLSDRGFSHVAHLARRAPAYRVRYSHFDQIENELPHLLKASAEHIEMG